MYLALWLQIMGGAINDFGPMLIISFITQEITYVKDSKGNIVEGDPVSNDCCPRVNFDDFHIEKKVLTECLP